MNHSHPIDDNESGQIGNEAALSFEFMWVGMLDKRCFFYENSIDNYITIW